MNWEFAEYCLSKFYTESRAVSTEDATWLFHNLLLLLLLLLPFAGTCSCSLGTRRANESENALNSNSHSHFFYFYLSYFVYYTMGVRRRGEKAERKTAPKYSEKTWSLYACASGAHWGTIFWTCTRTGQSIYRSFSRSLDWTKGEEWRGGEGREKGPADWGRDSSRLWSWGLWEASQFFKCSLNCSAPRGDDHSEWSRPQRRRWLRRWLRRRRRLRHSLSFRTAAASRRLVSCSCSCRVVSCLGLPCHFISCLASLSHSLWLTCPSHSHRVPTWHALAAFTAVRSSVALDVRLWLRLRLRLRL